MSFINVYIVYALLCINDVVESTTLTKLNRKGKESVLKPIELVDLILEKQRPELTPPEAHETDEDLGKRHYRGALTKGKELTSEVDASMIVRKVWSRWSKWGECSATCGGGAKTRRRLCLGGRCGPGEREEQRRPCCRQPCELN